ncbi:MAG: hypothetical protein IPF54_16290 [Draconibacterium sp.]|nr:hypothetical protein [Draconibacterium sp.]
MGIAFIVWIPQMMYWYSITGHFFVNSYPDEQFFWGNPHFIDGLFSYRKGWLLYTPVMIFALLGIPFLFKKLKEFSWSILIFILLAYLYYRFMVVLVVWRIFWNEIICGLLWFTFNSNGTLIHPTMES